MKAVNLTIWVQKPNLKMNSIYNVPKICILFVDWYANGIRYWPKTEKARKHFLRLERTHPCSPPVSSSFEESENVSLDTIHWIMLAKVLMCSCYVQGFHEEGNEYVKTCTIFIVIARRNIKILFLLVKVIHISTREWMKCKINVPAKF